MSKLNALVGACLVALLGATMVACSSDDDNASGESSSTSLPADAFPRTVSTVRGDIEIPEVPTRIVVLDSQSVDVVASLGIDPAAFDIASGDDLATLPWLDGTVDGTFEPGLVGPDSAIDYEAVLATDPDLIISDHWIAAEGEAFDRLNAIAPTITTDIDEAVGWQERVTFLSAALGVKDRGQTVIDSTNAAIAEANTGLESLDGQTYNYIAFSQEQGGFWYGNGDWLEDFKLTPAPGQDNTHNEFKVISLENVSDFQADVLGIWAMEESDKQVLLADPRFAALPAVKTGKLIWLDFALAVATNVPGPMSMVYVLDEVSPQLLAAVSNS